MRIYGNTVFCSADDVQDFMRNYPCSGLKGTRLWFQFDSTGDLIDIGPGNTSKQDGAGLLALSENAQLFLESRKRS